MGLHLEETTSTLPALDPTPMERKPAKESQESPEEERHEMGLTVAFRVV